MRPLLALTQGDPAGIGPEILLKLLAAPAAGWRPLLIAERAAVEALRPSLPDFPWDRLHYVTSPPGETDGIPVLDPVGPGRQISLGHPGPADAAGAMAALDAGIALVRGGLADALVTAPVSKESIARHHLPG